MDAIRYEFCDFLRKAAEFEVEQVRKKIDKLINSIPANLKEPFVRREGSLEFLEDAELLELRCRIDQACERYAAIVRPDLSELSRRELNAWMENIETAYAIWQAAANYADALRAYGQRFLAKAVAPGQAPDAQNAA